MHTKYKTNNPQHHKYRYQIYALGVAMLLASCASMEKEKLELAKMAARRKDFGKNVPALKLPQASCTRVDDKIEGDQFIGGHILCTIEKPAAWSK